MKDHSERLPGRKSSHRPILCMVLGVLALSGSQARATLDLQCHGTGPLTLLLQTSQFTVIHSAKLLPGRVCEHQSTGDLSPSEEAVLIQASMQDLGEMTPSVVLTEGEGTGLAMALSDLFQNGISQVWLNPALPLPLPENRAVQLTWMATSSRPEQQEPQKLSMQQGLLSHTGFDVQVTSVTLDRPESLLQRIVSSQTRSDLPLNPSLALMQMVLPIFP